MAIVPGRTQDLPRMGELYRLIMKLGDTEHVPDRNLLDRWFGPNAWYRTRFKDGEFSSTIWEYRNFWALDDYLDSISVSWGGRKVYGANVHRNRASVHSVNVFSNAPEWQEHALRLLEEYSN